MKKLQKVKYNKTRFFRLNSLTHNSQLIETHNSLTHKTHLNINLTQNGRAGFSFISKLRHKTDLLKGFFTEKLLFKFLF
jgi:hypothetical protein